MIDSPPPFNDPWFRLIVGCGIGGILGSFGTMLAYRLPRHLSIIFPRSSCPSCHTVLGVRDLVPMLSWLLAGGKCRHCHAPIGKRYLIIESVTALACGVASALIGISVFLPVAYGVILALVVAACLNRDT